MAVENPNPGFDESNFGDQTSRETIKWKAISLTHVEYQQGDVFGFLLAWISLLPIFIIIGFITLIIFRRDIHTLSYFCGLLVNETTNWVLKHIIREYRPFKGREVLTTEYGMPSSHAQFMWFFAMYLVFFLFIRVHQNYNLIDDYWKYVVGVGTFCLAFAVAYSRVYLEYHTTAQVVVGSLLGLIFGALWFCVVQLVFTPFFPVIAAWPVSEFLMVRDSTLIPNVMWFEYTSSRSEARSRQRKLTARKSQ